MMVTVEMIQDYIVQNCVEVALCVLACSIMVWDVFFQRGA